MSTITVDASGVTVNNTAPFNSGNGIKFLNGLIYGGSGQVINPTTKLIVGTFTNTGFGFGFNSFAVDAANGRVFFLISEGSNLQIRAYDINTFVPIGSIDIQGVFGFTITSLVRWGSNGLAFRTSDKVFLIQTALVNSSDPVPAPTPTPSPTPSPSPPHIPTFIRKLSLPANGLVFSQHNQSLYASVPSSAGANGNSITKIVPETGVTGPSVFIGSEPNRLALSDDGQTLYTHLTGANAIRRFDIPSHTAGLQFTAGNQPPIDMEVLPGSPQSIAVSRISFGGVAIFDNEVQRPNIGSSNFGIGFIDFGATASTLYGLSSQELVKFSVDSSGLSQSSVTSGLLTGSAGSFEFVNGLLYSGSGPVADPEAKVLKGRFQSGFSNSFVVDQANGRIFFLTNDSTPVLRAFDINTFLPLGAVTLNNVTGTPVNLVRWGVNGLAFNTVGNFSNTQSNVYLLQTALVSNAGTIPTGLQFSADSFFTFESIGNLQVTVSRTGDVSSATSVDFSTSNGTATAGSDYTATSGTLTFAAGELSKTISIPIIDDNLFEGGTSETINVNLTNPTGGAVIAGPAAVVVTINDNEFKPFLSVAPPFNPAEGNSGTSNVTFNVTLSNATIEVVTVDFATENGTATAGSDYVATSGTLTFQPGTTSLPINITINGDTEIEANETFLINLSNATNVNFTSSPATITIRNDDATLQFSAAQTNASENGNTVTVTVTRAGDTSDVDTVNFNTSDAAGGNNCNIVNGNASFRCDYSTTIGSLRFNPGQTSQTITISIVNDSYAEGDETFNVGLSNASGALLGAVSTATVKITDNEAVNGPNPVDEAQFFVRQHYRDFLNREPDAGGLAFWTNEITSCFPDPTCREIKRINVSAAFFLSIEFENTGFLVYRVYKTAYGDTTSPNVGIPVPIIRHNEFLPDAQRIGRGVQVGIRPWEAQLEANKNAYVREFVVRQRFLAEYPLTMTPAQFVDKLNLNAGGVLSQSERDQLVAELSAAGDVTQGRASVLRKVAEDADLRQRETTRAFVLMQYYGYMRRNPD
ncbi:MAG TPA: Calx-beta domain-containing protein, partial [Pyrinomonadaceae bacterium]|nr:Calx-beta domain-containing protein [Pyrinomonadaceae bacterium]